MSCKIGLVFAYVVARDMQAKLARALIVCASFLFFFKKKIYIPTSYRFAVVSGSSAKEKGKFDCFWFKQTESDKLPNRCQSFAVLLDLDCFRCGCSHALHPLGDGGFLGR